MAAIFSKFGHPALALWRIYLCRAISTLKKICFLARNIACDQGEKIKNNFDKNAMPHNFNINDLVWYEDFAPLGKNAKLTPKWQGLAKITEINDTNS